MTMSLHPVLQLAWTIRELSRNLLCIVHVAAPTNDSLHTQGARKKQYEILLVKRNRFHKTPLIMIRTISTVLSMITRTTYGQYER